MAVAPVTDTVAFSESVTTSNLSSVAVSTVNVAISLALIEEPEKLPSKFTVSAIPMLIVSAFAISVSAVSVFESTS